jgi:hypothetical protein
MKNLIFVVIFGVFLSGCTQPNEWTATSANLPSARGLEDCKFYKLSSGYKIVRCPNSTTSITYPEGKSTTTITEIEDSTPEHNCKVNATLEINGQKISVPVECSAQ